MPSARQPISLTLETKEWSQAVMKLMEHSKRDAGTELMEAVKLVIWECIKRTPPFTSWPNAYGESFGAQRRQGQTAVSRDVGKIYRPLKDIGIYSQSRKGQTDRTSVGQRVREVHDEHGLWGLEWILREVTRGGLQFTEIISEATEEHYDRQRSRRGRARRLPNGPILVKNNPSLNKLRRKKHLKVGMGKAGWMMPVMGLKSASSDGKASQKSVKFKSIPAWVEGQGTAGQGKFVANISVGGKDFTFFFRFSNTVAHAQKHGAERQIVRHAIRAQTHRLGKRIELAVAAAARKSKAVRVTRPTGKLMPLNE